MENYLEFLEHYYAEGLTDGLPVVPPLRELVDAAVAASGRRADETIGDVPLKRTVATVEDIAANAVMAGCRPEYMPVVIAAVEALLTDSFNLFHVAASTRGVAPLLVINGPIRRQLEMNCTGNVFGPGHRANATIGRAIRLVMINLGGARSQVVDKSSQGHPGKFTMCIGEDEEDSPWEPYHVSRGFAADESTVFVSATEAPRCVNVPATDRAEPILTCVAEMISPLGSYNRTGATEVVVILGPEHRAGIARDGYSRRDVQEWIYRHAARSARSLHSVFSPFPGLKDASREEDLVPLLASPDHVHVIAAGGAGRFSSVCFGFAAVTYSVSAMRVIRLPGA